MGESIPIILNFPRSDNGIIKCSLPHECTIAAESNWEIAVTGFYLRNCNTKTEYAHLCVYLLELDPDSISLGDFASGNLFFTSPISRCYYEPNNLTYNRLQCTVLQNLTFKITTERGKPVPIEEGNSYIKLRLRKMTEARQITLHLHKTDTKLEEFRINFHEQLRLEQVGRWRIGLLYMHYPNPRYVYDENRDAMYFSVRHMDILRYFYITKKVANTFTDVEDLITEVKRLLGTASFGKDASGKDITLEETIELMVFKPSYRSGIYNHGDRPVEIRFGKLLAYVLGNTTHGFHKADQFYGKTFLRVERFYQFDDTMDLKRRLPTPNINVVCDIISPVIVNSDYRRVLAVLPPEDLQMDHYHYEPKHMDFCDIQNSTISTINVRLEDHRGKLVDFGLGEEHTHAVTIALRLEQII